MNMNLLKEEIKEIKMSQDIRTRILEKCRNAELEEKETTVMDNTNIVNIVEEDNTVGKVSKIKSQKSVQGKSGKKWVRIATVAAAVTLCLGLGGITVMAASGELDGFFADVTRWDGAVVGTTYEQATEEIEVSASVNGDSLIVEAVFLQADKAPYVEIESFGIQAYQIKDETGNVILEGNLSETTDITDDKISMTLPIDELLGGSYTLIITEFVGAKKADQDLPVKGYWECEFEL